MDEWIRDGWMDVCSCLCMHHDDKQIGTRFTDPPSFFAMLSVFLFFFLFFSARLGKDLCADGYREV